MQAALHGSYQAEHINDPDLSKYFVSVEWLHTGPIEQAIKEVGMFGNQNTVCRPTTSKWHWTIERLKERLHVMAEERSRMFASAPAECAHQAETCDVRPC